MPKPSTILALLLLLVGAIGTRVLAETPTSARYRVIVHKSNPITSIDRQLLEDAFLKKITRWPDERPIAPVDLPPSSPVRQAFTKDVLRRSTSAVRSYWQQLIFAGRDVPPPELDSDELVIEYVRKREGGIGYVSSGAATDAVKVIELR